MAGASCGVMSHARIYINGKEVAYEPYGYAAFWVDVTQYIVSGDNVLAVKVFNPEHSSRWYPGAGIYRPVTLIQTGKEWIDPWNVVVQTPIVDPKQSEVTLSFKFPETYAGAVLRATVLSADGAQVGERQVVVSGESRQQLFFRIDLDARPNPRF